MKVAHVTGAQADVQVVRESAVSAVDEKLTCLTFVVIFPL
jgi:hypothetical protein